MELMASTYRDVTIIQAVFSVVELNIPVPGTSPPARLPLTLPFSLHPRSLLTCVCTDVCDQINNV